MNAQVIILSSDFQPHPISIHMLAIYVDTLTGSVSVYYLAAGKLEFSHANLYQRQSCYGGRIDLAK